MRHLVGLLLGLISVLLGAQHASALGSRTDEFMWACEERGGKDEWSNALGLMRCIGYLDGVMDSAVVLSIAHPEARPFCLPETGISLDQARLIFIKWAKDHPDQLHTAARISVAIALGTAFPCK